jgi:hypothetical protein
MGDGFPAVRVPDERAAIAMNPIIQVFKQYEDR